MKNKINITGYINLIFYYIQQLHNTRALRGTDMRKGTGALLLT